MGRGGRSESTGPRASCCAPPCSSDDAVCFLQNQLLVLAVESFLGLSMLAFTPNEAGHLGITSDALEPMGFSESAIFEIRDSNREVDIFEFHVEEAHFDNESLDAGSSRLIDLKEEIIQLLLQSPPDGEEAQETLGRALHAVQDFYAHSNWVELGMTAVETRLGREMLTPLSMSI